MKKWGGLYSHWDRHFACKIGCDSLETLKLFYVLWLNFDHSVLENLDVLPQKVLKLREIQVTKKQAKKHIESIPIPQYMQKAIWKRLFTKSAKTLNGDRDWDGTMYGIYMASTYVGSNMEKIRKSKNRVVEIEPQHVEQLQSFETITTDFTGKVPIPVAV